MGICSGNKSPRTIPIITPSNGSNILFILPYRFSISKFYVTDIARYLYHVLLFNFKSQSPEHQGLIDTIISLEIRSQDLRVSNGMNNERGSKSLLLAYI